MISRNKKNKKHTIHTYFSIRSITFLQLVQCGLQSLSWQGTYCARPCTSPPGQRLLVTGRPTLYLECARRRAGAKSAGTFPALLLHPHFSLLPTQWGDKSFQNTDLFCHSSADPFQMITVRSDLCQRQYGSLRSRLWTKDCSFICPNNKPLQFVFLKVLNTRVKLIFIWLQTCDVRPVMVLQAVFKTTRDCGKETFLMKFTY